MKKGRAWNGFISKALVMVMVLSLQSEWRCGTIPEDLKDRRVEITGPVDRKMIINALNSGAKVFMADFEDCTISRSTLSENGP